MTKNQNPPHLSRLRHRPLLAAIALALVASGAQAQTADSPDPGSDKPKSLDQVIGNRPPHPIYP
jgi:hypothetical protein